jgi:hypothetical protein
MKTNKSQKRLEEIDHLVAKVEEVLDQEIPNKKEVQSISDRVDQILASMGRYRRFFKRLA